MLVVAQTEAYRLWESQLSDRRAKTVIAARVARLASGLPGDVAPIGNGLSEMRIHYGPGYRIYFYQRGKTLVLLLCGGSKRTQARDIESAKRLARDWIN